jgi:hypothetical protein
MVEEQALSVAAIFQRGDHSASSSHEERAAVWPDLVIRG